MPRETFRGACVATYSSKGMWTALWYKRKKKENRSKLSELSRLFLLFGVNLDCSGIWDRCRGRTQLTVWVYPGAAKSCVPRISGSWIEGRDDLNDFYTRFIGDGSSMNVNRVNEWSFNCCRVKHELHSLARTELGLRVVFFIDWFPSVIILHFCMYYL